MSKSQESVVPLSLLLGAGLLARPVARLFGPPVVHLRPRKRPLQVARGLNPKCRYDFVNYELAPMNDRFVSDEYTLAVDVVVQPCGVTTATTTIAAAK